MRYLYDIERRGEGRGGEERRGEGREKEREEGKEREIRANFRVAR